MAHLENEDLSWYLQHPRWGEQLSLESITQVTISNGKDGMGWGRVGRGQDRFRPVPQVPWPASLAVL